MAKKFELLAVSAAVLMALASQANAAVGGTLTPLIGVATLNENYVAPNIVAGDPGGVPPDSAAAHIDANTSASLFSGVVSINIRYAGSSFICSGTLVNSFQVVSAGHCVDTAASGSPFSLIDISQPYAVSGRDIRVVFNSNGTQNAVITASAVVADPGYLGFGNCPAGNDPAAFCVNHDMSVITLSTAAPVTAKQYGVLATPLSGQVPITMVGYGTTGTGNVGYTAGSASFQTKRQGQNYAEFYETDDFQFFNGGPNGVYYADFDGTTLEQNLFCTSSHAADWGPSCAPSLANNVESSIGGGDSGGAAFVLVNGQYVLAANNTFSGTYTGQTGGTFGTYFGGINTGSELAFLQAATAGFGLNVVSVPEPGTYALMALGLVGMGSFVRRRKVAAQA
jgi:hypothetical protein